MFTDPTMNDNGYLTYLRAFGRGIDPDGPDLPARPATLDDAVQWIWPATVDEVATLDDVLLELREMRAEMRRLLARDDRHDGRLGEFLRETYLFAHDTQWTAGQLIGDARQAHAAELLALLVCVIRPGGDPARRLGRWLEKHAGAVSAGRRLDRIKREAGTWLYRVVELGV